MTNKIDTTEPDEVVDEFLKKTDPDNYKTADYHCLIDNGESLLDPTWYPESAYELDRESIAEWLRITLHHQLQKARKEVLLKVMQEIDDSKTEYNPARHGIEPDDIFDRVRSCVSSVVLEYYGRYDALDHSELDQDKN